VGGSCVGCGHRLVSPDEGEEMECKDATAAVVSKTASG
jgi:hypothetical protein